MSTERERFEAKIGPRTSPTACWNWQGYICGKGYGRFCRRGFKHPIWMAHRVAYDLAYGNVPSGHKMVIDHICRNRRCVNPSHLRVVDSRTNVLSGKADAAVNATKTACPKGHPFDAINTYIAQSKYGPKRHCRQCRQAQMAAFYERKRLAKQLAS